MIDIKNLKINLESKILTSDNIIIVPHKFADFDAIGSAIGLSLISKRLKKPSYIIDNDPLNEMEAGVKIIVDESAKEYNIINRDKYLGLSQAKSKELYILTDVNKKNLIHLSDLIENPDMTFIIDHHEEDSNTIESNNKYIDSKSSSASEIVTKLLCSYKIKIPTNVAKYLLAGIYLDTNKLTKNVTSETMKTVAKLLESGAVMSDVISLFKEDFYSDRRVQELVSKIEMLNYSLAVIIANDEDEYSREELAKAADYALKYGCDGVFAIGNVGDNTVSISARSNSKINVGLIMQDMGGGGNQYSGATKITDESVEEVGKKLQKIITPKYYIK